MATRGGAWRASPKEGERAFAHNMAQNKPELAVHIAETYSLGPHFLKQAMESVYNKFCMVDPARVLNMRHAAQCLEEHMRLSLAKNLCLNELHGPTFNYNNNGKEIEVRSLRKTLLGKGFSIPEIDKVGNELVEALKAEYDDTDSQHEMAAIKKYIELIGIYFHSAAGGERLNDLSQQNGSRLYEQAMREGRHADAAFIADSFGEYGFGNREAVEKPAKMAIEERDPESTLSLGYAIHIAKRFGIDDMLPLLKEERRALEERA